jgi:hypothetical protein
MEIVAMGMILMESMKTILDKETLMVLVKTMATMVKINNGA